ncbi:MULTISPECIES: class I SAM-dependent methyltransferase [Streptomyces]|uniref:SAM-dependent methyltransferase n=1 Tax=Streptomyces venezuelae TaxID=54571 RepID=A0A5P2BLZ1_STRVZ|nr:MULTISPECIES: class I SAM-dependent methyltransferase [Streptomyces]NEA00944.1 methyltransferase domain-containing protein [Streptomyces sp. SID10116]MYY85548.1 methyltransferase domain-containing protein [Streptomyces sp. SID335]MYZ12513.1 methyltransferase domain-containing protein [Streptomyces sp. SID337]NDZ85627.1 methyltransferase domain-containing protein [Streptomyces sp. SID10115]NEB42938.1 methyltransferase domain-containing protein [Streptomyces sp. SID339]
MSEHQPTTTTPPTTRPTGSGPDAGPGSGPDAGPDTILRLINGYWSTGILGAAAEHRLFTHLEDGAHDAAQLAARAQISERGAQTLLDGLVSIGLLTLEHGRYRNTPAASAYLVAGRPADLSAMARLKLTHMGKLAALPEVVRAGGPVSDPTTEVADNPHWGQVVPAIAAQSVPAAAIAADVLGLSEAGALSILDVGGGSGIYSATWLKANPAARATQLDWEPINAIARQLLAERGVADRFTCIDGDFHTTDFGTGTYDVALYSHIAHQEGPEDNIAVFTRLKDALKPGGALVVCDYVVDDDRSGPPFPLLFASEMLLKSQQGGTWRRADYHAWLTKAGFSDITFHSAPPATLVIAR